MEIAPPDILIVGSGIGGATMAAGLAPSGAQILILERGERLTDSAACRDARAIFQQGVFRPKEVWHDAGGAPFNPGNYYYVGGNSKFYGAVLIDFKVEQEDTVYPMVAAGASLNDMIRRPSPIVETAADE
jgi:choline dehydrogenase-like flavoprotein